MNKIYKSINLEQFKKYLDENDIDNKYVAYDLLEELVFMKETMEELKIRFAHMVQHTSSHKVNSLI